MLSSVDCPCCHHQWPWGGRGGKLGQRVSNDQRPRLGAPLKSLQQVLRDLWAQDQGLWASQELTTGFEAWKWLLALKHKKETTKERKIIYYLNAYKGNAPTSEAVNFSIHTAFHSFESNVWTWFSHVSRIPNYAQTFLGEISKQIVNEMSSS